jgi:hypothetical protein
MSKKHKNNKKNSLSTKQNGTTSSMPEWFAKLLSKDILGTVDTLERKREKNPYAHEKEQRRYRRIQKQRAEYGVSPSDLWNFSPSYVWYCLAQTARAYPSNASSEILEDTIFLFNGMDSWDFYANKKKNQEYYSQKQAEYNAHFAIVQERWLNNYTYLLNNTPAARVSDSDYIHDLAAIRSIPVRSELIWSQWKGVFTDPTTVALRELKENAESAEAYNKIVAKHKKQRIEFRISDLDIKSNPLGYIHLGIINAAIYCSSTEVHGWDVSQNDTWEEYSARLLKFAEGIYLAGFAGDRKLTEQEENIKNKAIADMPSVLLGLWD